MDSPNHPERPARLEAVLQGAHQTPVADALVPIEPRPATRDELERVHPAEYLDELERISEQEGGGWLDPDTGTSEASWEACRLGAGAVLRAAEALAAGEAQAAFCAVRPPGHHATRQHAMGFCLVNNVAVTAAALAEQGERVLIVDYDAHHGNGTQDIFYEHPTVFYASFHQWPLYPGTVRWGRGDGVFLPQHSKPPATGGIYLPADRIAPPVAEGRAAC